MKVKTRLIILGICVVVFFIAAPYIVLYSLGYRVNFETWQIKGTGGIYVYAAPEPDSILVSGKPAPKTGYFSSAVFVQNLLPGMHSVLIEKTGYHSYQKTLPVQERQVTKLENVTLFKTSISFTNLPLEIGETAKSQFALLTEQAASPRISPDGQKRIYHDVNEIYYVAFEGDMPPVLVRKSSAKISQVYWLNNDYLIFSEGETIVISEIDVRGNINTITLKPGLGQALKNPQIFFNQQDKKLYILTQKELLVSERLVP